MKRIVAMFLTVVCIITAFSIPTTTVSAATKNKFKFSDKGVLYVGNKYFFGTENGIYTSKTLTGTKKKIASKSSNDIWSGAYTPQMISDGKTVYFAVTKKSNKQYIDNKYVIYSVKSSGKSLKKIKTIDKGEYFKFITCYKGYIYFCAGYQHYASNLYKMKTSGKNLKKIKTGSSVGFYFNGSIYCNRAHSDVSKSTLYKVNPKTNKYKKYKDDAPFGVSQYPYFTTQKINRSGTVVKHYNIYTSTNGKSFKKSKKLPSSAYVYFASGKTKYAIIEVKNKPYKFNLKTGKKKKITGIYDLQYNLYGKVKADLRNDKVYFITKTDYSITVQKLSGTKAKTCKIDGMSSISSYDISNYNVVNGYLVVTENGKIKTYKLK